MSLSNLGITTGTNNLVLGWPSGNGAGDTAYIDDIYVDNGNDLSDPGPIRVTNKRPNANGTNNQFASQIGSGGSGYGSGHAPQVNEQPLNTANGWKTSSASQLENYTIEDATTGDANLRGDYLIADDSWAYANSGSSCTGTITNNGTTSSSIALTTTNTMFTNIVSNTDYPTNSAAVGIESCGSATTVSLYEAGMLIAYIAPTNDMLLRQGKWFCPASWCTSTPGKQPFTF